MPDFEKIPFQVSIPSCPVRRLGKVLGELVVRVTGVQGKGLNMRVMVLGKASKDTEAGVMPTREAWEAMEKYQEDLAQAGIVLVGEGLMPSSTGVRVRFTENEPLVTDGPFAETKELIAGYSIWQVNSMQEAVAWAKRCPLPVDSEVELRPLFCYSEEEVSEIVAQGK